MASTLRKHFDRPGWTLAVLPDLQNYTREQHHFPLLLETMEWLRGEGRELGVAAAIQVGDLTNDNLPEEWKRAREAFSLLDDCLPYVVTVGNHDLGRSSVGSCRFTRLNQYFRPEDNELNRGALVGAYRSGELQNTVHRLRLGDRDWHILSLEFGPRDGVVGWADAWLSKNEGFPTILLTHEYIDHLSLVRTGEARHTTPETHNSPYLYGVALEDGGVNCGEELWRALVEPHSQIRLVVNGHYRPFETTEWGDIIPSDGVASAVRVDVRADETVVHQHLVNAQWAPRGGDGWIKLFRFSPEGELIRNDLVSPALEQVVT